MMLIYTDSGDIIIVELRRYSYEEDYNHRSDLVFYIIPLSALADSGVDTLESFLYTLSPDLDMSTIESQAQELGLVTKSRKNGVGGKVYRIALNKNVADMNKPTKGSVITLTFDLLKNDSLKDVSYFEERRMISAFWSVNDGYTMIDYNNPSVFSGRLAIDSFATLKGYQPDIVTEDNLLEQLFVGISDNVTKDQIMDLVEQAGLTYNPRGAGNEEYITYDQRVRDKYGDDGSYLLINFTDGLVSKLEYHDFISSYWDGGYAVFYSQIYPYSNYAGSAIADQEIIKSLIKQLDRDDLSADERREIRQDLKELSDRLHSSGSENRNWISHVAEFAQNHDNVLLAAAGVIVGGFLGIFIVNLSCMICFA